MECASVERIEAGPAHLVTLGETLHAWREEIATTWRFTRNNGITEGFHNKMETMALDQKWGASRISGW